MVRHRSSAGAVVPITHEVGWSLPMVVTRGSGGGFGCGPRGAACGSPTGLKRRTHSRDRPQHVPKGAPGNTGGLGVRVTTGRPPSSVSPIVDKVERRDRPVRLLKTLDHVQGCRLDKIGRVRV
jgi:hypothetical protein